MTIWTKLRGWLMEMVPYGEKGRPMGERNGRSKWSDAVVEHMRQLKEDGRMTNAEICRQFNIPKGTLSDILSFKARNVTPTRWKPRKKT